MFYFFILRISVSKQKASVYRQKILQYPKKEKKVKKNEKKKSFYLLINIYLLKTVILLICDFYVTMIIMLKVGGGLF